MTAPLVPLSTPTVFSRFTLDAQIGTYGMNSKRTIFVHKSGNVAGAVAAADGAAQKIAKVHAAAGGKVVAFIVERLGMMPLVPGIETNDPNQVYLDGQVIVIAPAVQADGQGYVYSVQGWYRYAFRKPVFVNTATGLPLGGNTTDRTPAVQLVLPSAAFVDGSASGTAAPGDQPNVIRALVPKPPVSQGVMLNGKLIG